MSYYLNPFKYSLTHHAVRRARERLKMKNLSIDDIHAKLEEYLELAVFSGYQDNGCVIYVNNLHKITFVLDKNEKIIMTVY